MNDAFTPATADGAAGETEIAEAPPTSAWPNPFSDPTTARGANETTWSPSLTPIGHAELNPYAPPSEAAFSIDATLKPDARDRVGLPWEIEPSFENWWDTVKLVCSEPETAFLRMRVSGGLNSPTTFGMASVGATMAIGAAIQAVLRLMAGGPEAMMIAIVGFLCAVIACALLVPTIGWHIKSLFVHLFLSLVGGCNRGYETTYRAVAFATGGTYILQAIPCVGWLIYLFYGLYVNAIAVKRAHQTSGGKAAFAVLMPFFLLIALIVGIVVLAVRLESIH